MGVLQRKVWIQIPVLLVFGIGAGYWLTGCNSSGGAAAAGAGAPPPAVLPVFTIDTATTTINRDYTGTLQGKVNVEIRPKVDGYLQKIYVDEGAFVHAGQPLFKIDERTYRQQLNSAEAALHAAEAGLNSAQIDVDKLQPLVKNNVVSTVQLKSAEAALATSKANVEQAKANVESARINLDYTLIKAPVTGYIGKIPFRLGSLVSSSQTDALTLLSDVHEVYAYFSIGENDFILFKEQYKGNTIEEKLKNVPPVSLILADNSVYPVKGRIEIVEGQFDANTGSITLRATFPNPQGLLRSGNTGRVRVTSTYKGVIMVPQASTVELQEKTFVFTVADSNKVKRVLINIDGKSGNNLLIKEGLKQGDKVVVSGIDRLQEGTVITPQPISKDSALQVHP